MAMNHKKAMEEKQNRIVEVMISSVKPFQLMMGKIIGIGLVGLTQFMIWALLGFVVQIILGSILAPQLMDMQAMNQQGMGGDNMQILNAFNSLKDQHFG